MTYEPEDCRSVSICNPKRADEGRTREETIAAIRARFPDCFTESGLAILTKLAKRENRAMNRIKDRPQIEVSEKAKQMAAEARMAQGRETMRIIVDCITGTMTTADVIRVSGLTERQVEQALERAVDRGLIVKGKLKRMNVWAKPQELNLPEPEPKGVAPEPVTLTVRGQEFPSLRACAKHFGISVQAVADAVRRGNPDGIGMRRMEAAE